MINFTCGHVESFRYNQEVMYQRVHVSFHCFTVGQYHFRSVGFYRTWFQTRKRLHYYLVRLLHLAHAHEISRPHVSVAFGWYLEVVVLITAVRVGAPDIQIHTTAAQARTG